MRVPWNTPKVPGGGARAMIEWFYRWIVCLRLKIFFLINYNIFFLGGDYCLVVGGGLKKEYFFPRG